MPTSLISCSGIYTFGNSLNAFNSAPDQPHDPNSRTLRHTEHYANRGEYVSRIGILVFVEAGSGGGVRDATRVWGWRGGGVKTLGLLGERWGSSRGGYDWGVFFWLGRLSSRGQEILTRSNGWKIDG